MKRFILDFLLVIVFFIIHITLFDILPTGKILPNILIILTVSCAFCQGEKGGLSVGFACGLLLDIYSFNVLGLNALILMLLGFAVGYISNTFYQDDIKLPLLIVGLADLMYSLSIYTLTFVLRGHFNFEFYFINIILPEIAYTILIALPVYPLISFLDRKVSMIGENKNNEAAKGI